MHIQDFDDELDDEDSELGLLTPIAEEAPCRQADTGSCMNEYFTSEVKGNPRRPPPQQTPKQPSPVPVTNQTTHTISQKASQTQSQHNPCSIPVATQAGQNIGQPYQATKQNQVTNVPQILGQPTMVKQVVPTSSANPNAIYEIPGTSTVNPRMMVSHEGDEEQIGAPVHLNHSASSRRHSAFDDELELLDQKLPIISRLTTNNADVCNLPPEDNKRFEVIVEDIPMQNGKTKSRITIRSCTSIDMKSPSQDFQNKLFCIDASKAPQMPMAMELPSSEENPSTPPEPNACTLEQTMQALTPLQIQAKPSNITGGVLKKEKSQVHFDIGMIDDRTIVLTHEKIGDLSRTSISSFPKR